MSAPVGLLAMHYGTPASMDEVAAYYTHIRRGRPPSPEELEHLEQRYRTIGGPSPLTAISEAQAEAIAAGLRKRGLEAKAYLGAKHAAPFVGDAIRQMASDGVREAIGIVLAPHYSSFSVAAYRRAAVEALEPGMTLEFVERWGELPEFIEALAERVSEAISGWDSDETLVIFTAHSLPQRIVGEGDPYPDELARTSELVAAAAGVLHWRFAYQSASKTGEPWLGPDILDVIEGEDGRFKNVLACTVGFVSDHLEVLYDLGIEAREQCVELGLIYRVAKTIGADPKVMDALAGLCAGRLARSSRA